MSKVFPSDWGKILLPDTPLLEIILRGSLMYIALFLMLRFILKRQAGTVGITDLLVITLIADAAQNGMANDYSSISDGILLVGVIIGWSYLIDWLGYRFPRFQRIVHPGPLPLIKDGRMLRRNMRQELITEGELMTQLREQGIEDIRSVRSAFMEGDGRISVISYDS